MKKYLPYTYLIGWSVVDKWYYGVQTRKDCHPEQLWKSYFTSSKIVKQFRKIYGDPDIIQVRKTFDTSEAALSWEIKVFKRLKVNKNDRWLNQSVVYMDGSRSSKNWMKTPDGRKLLRELKRKDRELNPEKYIPWNKNKSKNSDSRLIKASEIAKEHMKSGHLNCIGDVMRGKKFSDEHRKKLSKAALARPKLIWISNLEQDISKRVGLDKIGEYLLYGWVHGRSNYISQITCPDGKNPQLTKSTCPHCGKIGQTRNMYKTHFNKCKLNFAT